MYTNQLLLQTETPVILDPTAGASRVGYREITGDVPSTGEEVSLLCLAVVFEEEAAAFHRYQDIVHQLARVDGNGLAVARIPRFDADRFGNMSERTDSLGDVATLWVTGTSDGGEERGAVLMGAGGSLIQMLALTQYEAADEDRATRMVERLALAMTAREADLNLEPWAATMSYLPLLQDVGDLLLNTSITYNRYGVPSTG